VLLDPGKAGSTAGCYVAIRAPAAHHVLQQMHAAGLPSRQCSYLRNEQELVGALVTVQVLQHCCGQDGCGASGQPPEPRADLHVEEALQHHLACNGTCSTGISKHHCTGHHLAQTGLTVHLNAVQYQALHTGMVHSKVTRWAAK
jgi:hypothetical protein